MLPTSDEGGAAGDLAGGLDGGQGGMGWGATWSFDPESATSELPSWDAPAADDGPMSTLAEDVPTRESAEAACMLDADDDLDGS